MPEPAINQPTLAALPRITVAAREPNLKLWTLLTRPGPLSAAEWAYIDEQEHAHQES